MPIFSPLNPEGMLSPPMFTLLLALVLDAAAGEMPLLFRWIPHPVVAIGRLIAWAEGRLNRAARSDSARRVRGVLLVLVLVGGAYGLGLAVEEVGSKVPFAWPLLLILTAALIAQRSLYAHVAAVGAALESEGLEGGRREVAKIVGRSPERLDRAGVSRAAIESLAENFSDGVAAPVFWFVMLGFPGLLAYKVINTLDSMIGYKNERYRAFGWAAARFDDLANLIPARLAGLLIVLVSGRRAGRALRSMLRFAGKHRSPNAGWPEAAMAGALGLKLAGPRHYPHMTVDDPWIGDGTAEAGPEDIARGLRVYIRACIGSAILVVAVWLI